MTCQYMENAVTTYWTTLAVPKAYPERNEEIKQGRKILKHYPFED